MAEPLDYSSEDELLEDDAERPTEQPLADRVNTPEVRSFVETHQQAIVASVVVSGAVGLGALLWSKLRRRKQQAQTKRKGKAVAPSPRGTRTAEARPSGSSEKPAIRRKRSVRTSGLKSPTPSSGVSPRGGVSAERTPSSGPARKMARRGEPSTSPRPRPSSSPRVVPAPTSAGAAKAEGAPPLARSSLDSAGSTASEARPALKPRTTSAAPYKPETDIKKVSAELDEHFEANQRRSMDLRVESASLDAKAEAPQAKQEAAAPKQPNKPARAASSATAPSTRSAVTTAQQPAAASKAADGPASRASGSSAQHAKPAAPAEQPRQPLPERKQPEPSDTTRSASAKLVAKASGLLAANSLETFTADINALNLDAEDAEAGANPAAPAAVQAQSEQPKSKADSGVHADKVELAAQAKAEQPAAAGKPAQQQAREPSSPTRAGVSYAAALGKSTAAADGSPAQVQQAAAPASPTKRQDPATAPAKQAPSSGQKEAPDEAAKADRAVSGEPKQPGSPAQPAARTPSQPLKSAGSASTRDIDKLAPLASTHVVETFTAEINAMNIDAEDDDAGPAARPAVPKPDKEQEQNSAAKKPGQQQQSADKQPTEPEQQKADAANTADREDASSAARPDASKPRSRPQSPVKKAPQPQPKPKREAKPASSTDSTPAESAAPRQKEALKPEVAQAVELRSKTPAGGGAGQEAGRPVATSKAAAKAEPEQKQEASKTHAAGDAAQDTRPASPSKKAAKPEAEQKQEARAAASSSEKVAGGRGTAVAEADSAEAQPSKPDASSSPGAVAEDTRSAAPAEAAQSSKADNTVSPSIKVDGGRGTASASGKAEGTQSSKADGSASLSQKVEGGRGTASASGKAEAARTSSDSASQNVEGGRGTTSASGKAEAAQSSKAGSSDSPRKKVDAGRGAASAEGAQQTSKAASSDSPTKRGEGGRGSASASGKAASSDRPTSGNIAERGAAAPADPAQPKTEEEKKAKEEAVAAIMVQAPSSPQKRQMQQSAARGLAQLLPSDAAVTALEKTKAELDSKADAPGSSYGSEDDRAAQRVSTQEKAASSSKTGPQLPTKAAVAALEEQYSSGKPDESGVPSPPRAALGKAEAPSHTTQSSHSGQAQQAQQGAAKPAGVAAGRGVQPKSFAAALAGSAGTSEDAKQANGHAKPSSPAQQAQKPSVSVPETDALSASSSISNTPKSSPRKALNPNAPSFDPTALKGKASSDSESRPTLPATSPGKPSGSSAASPHAASKKVPLFVPLSGGDEFPEPEGRAEEEAAQQLKAAERNWTEKHNFPATEKLAKKVLAAGQAGSVRPFLVQQAACMLADILHQHDRDADALPYARQALEAADQAGMVQHAISNELYLALALRTLGQAGEAKEAFQDALQRSEAHFGVASAPAMHARKGVADLLVDLGEKDGAVAMLNSTVDDLMERATEAEQRRQRGGASTASTDGAAADTSGEGSEAGFDEVVTARDAAARVLLEVGRVQEGGQCIAEADAAFERAVQLSEQAHGRGKLPTSAVLAQHAGFLKRQGDEASLKRSVELYAQVLAMMEEASGGAGSQDRAMALRTLAELNTQLNNHGEAAVFAERAVRTLQALDRSHLWLPHFWQAVVDAREKAGDKEGAQAARREASKGKLNARQSQMAQQRTPKKIGRVASGKK